MGLFNKRLKPDDDSSDGSDSPDSISEISDLDSTSSESDSDRDSNPFGGSGSDSDESTFCFLIGSWFWCVCDGGNGLKVFSVYTEICIMYLLNVSTLSFCRTKNPQKSPPLSLCRFHDFDSK